MLSGRTLPRIRSLATFALLTGLALAPALAADSSKTTDGATRPGKITLDGDTLRDFRGPQQPKGPILTLGNGADGASTGVGIGLDRWRSAPRAPFSEKGIFLPTGQPSLIEKPLETKVTAIKDDAIVIDTPTGKGTIRVTPGRLAASGIEVGTRITVTADNGSATVRVRAASPPHTPYAGIFIGTLQSSGDTFLKLRLRGGAIETFSANRDVGRLARTLNGRTIALQSSDGRTAHTLLTSQQLNRLLNSIPKSHNDYIGRIVNATDSALTLDLRNGILQKLQCSNCAGHKLGSLSLVRGLTVYAVSDAHAHLLDLAPVATGTRIVAQLTSAKADAVSIMLASGDVATVPCACGNLLAGLGNVGLGESIIADLDQNASITSLLRFPDDGRLTGKLIDMRPHGLSLLLSNGTVKSFACECLGRLSSAKASVGKMVTATLDPEAEVVAIAASPKPRCQLPYHQPNAANQKAARNDSICDDGIPKRKTVKQIPASMPSLRVAAVTACAQSDSGAIFIMLRHWRSRTPVGGASVKLSGPASIALASPPSGYIELLNVPLGAYHLTVQKTGLRAMETSEFDVNCNDAIRVQADLQTVRRMVRVIRIQKRQLVFRVVSKQKTPLNCFYGSFAANDVRGALEKTFVVRTAKGYYTCGLKKVPVWKRLRQ